jgi:hypothetical protein
LEEWIIITKKLIKGQRQSYPAGDSGDFQGPPSWVAKQQESAHGHQQENAPFLRQNKPTS